MFTRRLATTVFALVVAGGAALAAAPTVREAVALSKAGKHAEALKVLDELVGKHPDHAKLRLMRAKTAFLAGKAELATKELTALGKDPVVGSQATALLAKIRIRLAATSVSPSPSPSLPDPPPASPSPGASPAASPAASPSPAAPEIDYGGGIWSMGMSIEEFRAAMSGEVEDRKIESQQELSAEPDGAKTRFSVRSLEFLGQMSQFPAFRFDAGGKLIGASVQDVTGKREELEPRAAELVELLTHAYGPPHEGSVRKERSTKQGKYFAETSLWSFPRIPAVLIMSMDPPDDSTPGKGELRMLFGTHPWADPEVREKIEELRALPPLPRPSPGASPGPGEEEPAGEPEEEDEEDPEEEESEEPESSPDPKESAPSPEPD